MNNFKVIKCNFKQNKNFLEFFYSFSSNKKNNSKQKKNVILSQENKLISFFDDNEFKENENNDIRNEFSKEIINSLLNDLNIKEINNDKLDKLFNKVHDILNRFQNISYSRGYHANNK